MAAWHVRPRTRCFGVITIIVVLFFLTPPPLPLANPSSDHAGIATQLLVERAVVAEGTTRQAMGREAFLDRVWAWKEEKGGYITGQMRRLGASADWTRERFTLEPSMSDSVTEAFVRMHERGLIYKGDYLVNWSPNLQTAVSDLEVEYSEEMGKLYYFKYQLADEDAFIPVAHSVVAESVNPIQGSYYSPEPVSAKLSHSVVVEKIT